VYHRAVAGAGYVVQGERVTWGQHRQRRVHSAQRSADRLYINSVVVPYVEHDTGVRHLGYWLAAGGSNKTQREVIEQTCDKFRSHVAPALLSAAAVRYLWQAVLSAQVFYPLVVTKLQGQRGTAAEAVKEIEALAGTAPSKLAVQVAALTSFFPARSPAGRLPRGRHRAGELGV
jgi:hypothetical protein